MLRAKGVLVEATKMNGSELSVHLIVRSCVDLHSQMIDGIDQFGQSRAKTNDLITQVSQSSKLSTKLNVVLPVKSYAGFSPPVSQIGSGTEVCGQNAAHVIT